MGWPPTIGKSMKMTNGRHKKDESLDKMNKKVSKTENFEKLTETFRRQSSAAKEIKTWTAKNLFYFYFDFSNFRVGRALKTTY